MIKIIAYGAGKWLELSYPLFDKNKAELIAIIDSAESKHGFSSKYNVPVIFPREIFKYNFDYVIICSSYVDEMEEVLAQQGVEKEKILYSDLARDKWLRNTNESLIAKKGKVNSIFSNNPLERRAYVIIDDFLARCRPASKVKMFDDYVIETADYVRFGTLLLISEQILKKGVMGDVAELGVFQGDFAALIQKVFPDKFLYLFDTFEGIPEIDLKCDTKEGLLDNVKLSEGGKAFGYVSIESVLEKMEDRSKCIVRKGYFPDTVRELPDDICFAFVNIDADVYKPTLAGLEYFYGHLSDGGFIMVHDYNERRWEGVAKAVDEFCSAQKIVFVPICDSCGSIIITK